MGDASLPAQVNLQGESTDERQYLHNDSVREINVLVTGFGSFKSFITNPSYLVASNLSRQLNPESESSTAAAKFLSPPSQHPIRDPNLLPYIVIVHTYPDPVKVAYDAVLDLIPGLVSDSVTQESSPTLVKPANGFDYILHIGMAAGRDNYTLETVAHRDHYKLKGVDDKDGSNGEKLWRELNFPSVLDVGWNKEDVLSRWEALTRQREDEYEQDEMKKAGWTEDRMTLVETARLRSRVFLSKGRRAVVKLSRDAGRYLCEFIFFTGLSTRWKEARDVEKPDPLAMRMKDSPKEKIGKVAFLHVPGGTGAHDIERGVRVAESAILAIVSSWEDGFRNPDVYGGTNEEKKDALPSPSRFEDKGTGDR